MVDSEMAPMHGVTLAFLLLISFVYGQENTLNVPQVLLPFADEGSLPTEYVLKALKGCFHWTTSNPGVASIKPYFDQDDDEQGTERDCSQGVTVTAVAKTISDKETAVILAEDSTTGFVLRCDVFVDKIHHFEIATTTKELLLGESPEVFEIFAYDEEGNLFSALGSTQVKWSFHSVAKGSGVDPNNVLRFIQFQDSSYETTAEIYNLESKGSQGSSVLVEGINTGQAVVKASLSSKSYKNVEPSTVKLVVVDNLMLIPSQDVYIMIQSYVIYTIKQLRRGISQIISMPSEQYSLKLSDTNVGRLNDVESSVTGLKYGVTKVLLVDKNMINTKSARQPSANVYVVEPGYLGFALKPGRQWILEVGKEYEITVEIFDNNKHKILITDNTVLSSMFPDVYFEMLSESNNQSYHHVKAIKKGTTQIEAELQGVKGLDSGEVLKFPSPIFGTQKIEIYDPLRVVPKTVVFPWCSTLAEGRVSKYQLIASGGSGGFAWSSDNTSFATVTNKGVLATGMALGQSMIKVADAKNQLHFDTSTVYVLPPNEIHFVDSRVEAEIGTELTLLLSMSSFVDKERTKKMTFDDCSMLPFKTSLLDESIFKIVRIEKPLHSDEDVDQKHCATLIVKATKLGNTVASISYEQDRMSLSATITIAAYHPIKVVSDQSLVTALGSASILILDGGPMPWVLDSSRYFESLLPIENSGVQIKATARPAYARDLPYSSLHFFEVTCTNVGQLVLDANIGNKATAQNKFPASSSTQARFKCGIPASISLKPDITYPLVDGHRMTIDNCQDNEKNVPVRNSRDLKIIVTVRDESGNVFGDFSSLEIKWSSSDPALGQIVHKSTQTTILRRKESLIPSAHQVVRLSASVGQVQISAEIIGYMRDVMRRLSIKAESLALPSAIRNDVSLALVYVPSISPSSINILQHPDNKINLQISGGSSHFVIKNSNPSLAQLTYQEPAAIQVVPHNEGKLIVKLFDICLDLPTPASAKIILSDVYTILSVIPDKVELTKSIMARAQILDADNEPINVVDMKLMKLEHRLSANLLDVSPIENEEQSPSELPMDTAKYNLVGTAVGLTSLTFYAKQRSGRQISSQPADVQVFPPLKLDPGHLILISGSTFQVHSKGGPRPHANVVFSIGNQTVGDINSFGVISALVPGKTIIKGTSQGTDPHTGQLIVYSEDTIILEVIVLDGFKILCQSKNVATGTEISLRAIGLNDESPFTFATSIPTIKFHWSSSNNEVATLNSVYSKTGVKVSAEKDFRIVFKALTAGQTSIKLRVEVDQSSRDQVTDGAILNDEIQILVFDPLRLVFPPKGRLLLPHNVRSFIITNRDGDAHLTYEVLGRCSNHQDNLIDVGYNGQIETSSASGVAVVLVTSHEDFGFNQTVSVQVEVETVADLALVSHSSLRVLKGKRHSFPIGASALFKVTLLDNVGRKFDSTNVPIFYRTHKSGTILVKAEADNSSLVIKAMDEGEAVLKVWLGQTKLISDYIRLIVRRAIVPESALLILGQAIRFQSLVSDVADVKSGTWSVSSPSVLSIDTSTGNAVASSTGATVIYYKTASGDATHTEINVKAPDSLRIDQNEIPLFTNAPIPGLKSIRIPFTFQPSNDFQSEQIPVSIDASLVVPFTCDAELLTDGTADLSINAVFTILPGYDSTRPVCEFIAKPLTLELTQHLAMHRVTLFLKVILKDRSSEFSLISNTVTADLIGGMFVSANEVILRSSRPRDRIHIHGSRDQLDNLKVVIEDASLITVVAVASRESASTMQSYDIALVDDIYSKLTTAERSFKTAVSMRSHQTGQLLRIIVSIELDSNHDNIKASTTPFYPSASATYESQIKRPVSGSGLRTLFYSLINETGFWLIGWTLLVATVVIILLLYHFVTYRYRHHDHPIAVYATPGHSPPPYQKNSDSTPSSPWSPVYKRSPNTATPQRTLFSVSQ